MDYQIFLNCVFGIFFLGLLFYIVRSSGTDLPILAHKLYIPQYIIKKISYCEKLKNISSCIIITISMFMPMINIIIFVLLIFILDDDWNEKDLYSRYKKYLNRILKKVGASEYEAKLIFDNIINKDSENHVEILEKFIEMVQIVERELEGDKYEEKKKIIDLIEIIDLIKKSRSSNDLKSETNKKTVIDKDFKLNNKEIKEYITNLEKNKQTILKYLDNQTEKEYRSILNFALSKDKNPYYRFIIENAYILTNIINDFEKNNYILNSDKNKDTKNQIRKSIFEFIDVINLIDDLNYKQDKTFENIENYNNYLESIKSDIKNKLAIFVDK